LDIHVEWQGGLKFSGESLFGLPISTDASLQAGGNEDGYKPTELLFFALAGCTGMDVVLISKKMRQEIKGLKIKVTADQREEQPKAFTKAHIEYIVTGAGLDQSKLEQAIKLSEEKYCSVGATLSGLVRITHTLTMVEG
jgi:putative redox protein